MKLAYILALCWSQTGTAFAPQQATFRAKRVSLASTKSLEDVSHYTDDWIAEHFNEGIPDDVDEAIFQMKEGAKPKYRVFDWYSTASPESPNKIQQVSSSAFENLERFALTPPQPLAAPSLESLSTFVASAVQTPPAASSMDGPNEWFSDALSPSKPESVPALGKGPTDWFSAALGLNPDSAFRSTTTARDHADWFMDAVPSGQPRSPSSFESLRRLVPTAVKPQEAPSLNSLSTFVASAMRAPSAASSLEGPKEWFSDAVNPSKPGQASPFSTAGNNEWFSQALFAQ